MFDKRLYEKNVPFFRIGICHRNTSVKLYVFVTGKHFYLPICHSICMMRWVGSRFFLGYIRWMRGNVGCYVNRKQRKGTEVSTKEKEMKKLVVWNNTSFRTTYGRKGFLTFSNSEEGRVAILNSFNDWDVDVSQ